MYQIGNFWIVYGVDVYVLELLRLKMSINNPARGQIHSLYTGRKYKAQINGRIEPTAFVRTLRQGSIALGQTGFAGDELGTSRRLGEKNHAVYLFAERHYAHFEEVLDRPIPRGSFSENILYSGPEEMDIRIGDHLQIGDAVIEITSPRVPCYKMAHFLGTDNGFPSQFSASSRTGFYAKIIEAGSVSAGNTLEVILSNPLNATIAEFNEVLTGDRPGADLVARVVTSPAMLPAAQVLINERMNILSLGEAAETRPVTITNKTLETPEIVTLSFNLGVPFNEIPKPGQFLTFGVEDNEGNQHFNCYSLTNGAVRDSGDEPYRISVKRERKRANAFSVSTWIHEQISIGDICTVYPPAGNFHLPDDPTGPLSFIAGGIGITPILAQIRTLAGRNYADPIDLIYVSRSSDELAFLDELIDFTRALGQFSLRVFVTGQADRHCRHSILINAGRPDLALEIAAMDENSHLFVCGPTKMIEAVQSAHAELRRPNSLLHFEHFSESVTLDEAISPAASAKITISPSGDHGSWQLEDGSLLKWIETNTDHRPVAACRSGMCRTCATPLLRGRVVYPASVVAPAPTEALLCCALPATDIEIGLPDNLPVNPTG
jgi:ferredoxin-NADP reductase/MOSC domain-containing protein YiiM